MDSLREILRSLSSNRPFIESLSLSSNVTPPKQKTKFINGLPVISPIDSLDEVQMLIKQSWLI